MRISKLLLLLLFANCLYGHQYDAATSNTIGLELTPTNLCYDISMPIVMLGELQNHADLTNYNTLQQIKNNFIKKCPQIIDGIEVIPTISPIFIEEYDDSLMESYLSTSKFGLSGWSKAKFKLNYSLKTVPAKIIMQWDMWLPQDIKKNIVKLHLDSGGSGEEDKDEIFVVFKDLGLKRVIAFSKVEPSYIWHTKKLVKRATVRSKATFFKTNRQFIIINGSLLLGIWIYLILMKRKKLSLILAVIMISGTALIIYQKTNPKLPDFSQRESLFKALHANIYRAFDYQSEDDIYDSLEQSVSAELLDQIYNDIFQSLILRDEGGAICQIEKVAMLSLENLPDENKNQFKIKAKWQVRGLVKHWSHVHKRVNQYEAIYTLSNELGIWKISGVEMISQNRLENE